MIDLLRLCRLYYAVPMSLAYTLTVYYARGGRMAAGHWLTAWLSTAALLLVIAAGYVFNDVSDWAVDRINAPTRPIAAGRVRRRTAAAWGACLLAAGLATSASCGWPFFLALSGVAAGLMFYNLFSKRLGVAKQLLVAALMTSIYPLAFIEAGGVAGGRAGSLAIFPVWLFLTSFGYELLKDLRDISGDQSAGMAPMPWQSHPKLWRAIARAAILVAAPILVGPFLAGCGWVYMAIAGVAMLAAVVSVFLPVRWAIRMIYLECFTVGVAATADVMVFGV